MTSTPFKILIRKVVPKSRINRLLFVFVIFSFVIGLFFDHSTYVENYYSAFRRSINAIKDIKSDNCGDLVSPEGKKSIIENSGDIEFVITLERDRQGCKSLINEISAVNDYSIEISEKSIGERFENEYAWYILKNDLRTGFFFFMASILVVGLMKMAYKVVTWILSGEK